MTNQKEPRGGRKVGRKGHDGLALFIRTEALRRASGLKVNAMVGSYRVTSIVVGRQPREWPVVGGKSLRKVYYRARTNIFELAERAARAGAPEHLQRVQTVVDRLVDEYIAIQGPEWVISVQEYGDAVRQARSRQYRREKVRNVSPKKRTSH